MKTLIEMASSLSWIELLGILCGFIDHAQCKYDIFRSNSLDSFNSEFARADIERSLPDIYALLFCRDRQDHVATEIGDLLETLKRKVRDPQDSLFNEIEFLQQVVSTALWKYGIQIKPALESFAREFDRIDDERERLRIIAELKN
jgi:hypothetical protein